jgi:hypothetical protein
MDRLLQSRALINAMLEGEIFTGVGQCNMSVLFIHVKSIPAASPNGAPESKIMPSHAPQIGFRFGVVQ